MKLTKGKISKLFHKKKQTMKKMRKHNKKPRQNTFRKNKKLNLASKTLKRINYKGGEKTEEEETKVNEIEEEPVITEMNLIDEQGDENVNPIQEDVFDKDEEEMINNLVLPVEEKEEPKLLEEQQEEPLIEQEQENKVEESLPIIEEKKEEPSIIQEEEIKEQEEPSIIQEEKPTIIEGEEEAVKGEEEAVKEEEPTIIEEEPKVVEQETVAKSIDNIFDFITDRVAEKITDKIDNTPNMQNGFESMQKISEALKGGKTRRSHLFKRRKTLKNTV